MEVGCSAPEVEVAWKETLTVHEVRKKSAMVRSLRELEQREDLLDREGMRVAMSPKGKKGEGKGGSGMAWD